MKDLLNALGTDAARASINVAARSSTVSGSGVDLKGYEGAACVGVMGAWAGNQGTWAVTLQDSSDNSTFTAVASKYLTGTALTMSGQINRALMGQGYIGPERYLRAVATLTGGGQNCTFGVIVVRGYKRHLDP